jgi:uncharacterized protein (TIGR02599 family)
MDDPTAPAPRVLIENRKSKIENRCFAFTLVEMLVAMAILVTIMVLSFQMIDRTNSIWSSTSSKLEQFRGGREAFDAIGARLAEATLDQYEGYQFQQMASLTGTISAPTSYGRRSELRFLCGPGATEAQVSSTSYPCVTDSVFFVAPLGVLSGTTATAPTVGEYGSTSANYPTLPGLLNICGYFIQWSNNDLQRPALLGSTNANGGNDIYRFRLLQFIQPAEEMTLYNLTTAGSYPNYALVSTTNWQTSAMTASPASVRQLAENVVALLLLPASSTTDTTGALAPGFLYDSENPSTTGSNSQLNRLPPVVRVVLYTIDDVSAHRLANTAAVPNLYTTSTGQPLFVDPTKLYPAADGSDPGDLSRFETVLINHNLKFRRFETAVELLPEPWTQDL